MSESSSSVGRFIPRKHRTERTRGRVRLGIDAHILDGKYQGSRTWLAEILERAPHLLPEIDFVVYCRDSSHLPDGGNVFHRPLGNLPSLIRTVGFWPYAVARDKLDLLLTQYMGAPLYRRRQVVVIHDVLFESRPELFPPRARRRKQIPVRWSAREARKVVTVSEFSRREIADHYGIDHDEIGLVRNGVNRRAFSEPVELPVGIHKGTPFGLFVSRLEPRKNLALVLDALDEMDNSEARLVVVGKNDFEDASTLNRLTTHRRVTHLVDVPSAQLAALYETATVFVYPSVAEGWGIPVLEALSAGTPVIASSMTAIPEAGGPACHYFDPTSHNATQILATLMDQAFDGSLEFDKGMADAHVSVLSWDASAAAFAQIISEITET